MKGDLRVRLTAEFLGTAFLVAAVIGIAYSGEVDQGSGVMPISVPVDSDQGIGAKRRWRDAS